MKITYNDVFNCYETTECDCKFGKAITLDGVPMIPVTEIIELRDNIQKIHDETDAKAKAQELYRGINEKADLACFLYRNDFIKPLDELIERYSLKEKREEKETEFKNSDNPQDENDSLHFNEEELQDICMTCLYAYELMHDDGYTREEIENKLSFDKYLFFALKYIDNHLSISEVIEKYAKEYFALKDNQSIQQQSENEEELER